MEFWPEYTRFLVALTVIMDPFAAVPLFIALTHGYTHAERRKVAMVTSLTVIFVLLFTAYTGEALLVALGTSLASFRVGGGLILLLMALSLLRADPHEWRTTSGEASAASGKSSVAIVPLAIPLLAGPGAISTVIIEMHRNDGITHFILVGAVIVFVGLMLWLVLHLAVQIGKSLGQIGLNIINRIFGLILTAIGVEIMAGGLRELFPILGG